MSKVLNHSFVQRDREGQPGGPGDNYIVYAEVREADEELLILVYRTRGFRDDHGLPHTFEPRGTHRHLEGLSLRPNLVEAMVTNRWSLC